MDNPSENVQAAAVPVLEKPEESNGVRGLKEPEKKIPLIDDNAAKVTQNYI